MSKLKLYVWEEVLTDYTDGMMVALAHNKDEAIKLLMNKLESYDYHWLEYEPKVITKPGCFFVHGGG